MKVSCKDQAKTFLWQTKTERICLQKNLHTKNVDLHTKNVKETSSGRRKTYTGWKPV